MQLRFRFMAVTLAVIMIAAMAGTSFAVKASPRPLKLTQPDGSSFLGVLMGDEHFSFAETDEGYSIICGSDNWWTYAKQENGLLLPTNAKVGKDNPPYQQHLRPNAEAVANIPRNQGRQINTTSDTRHKRSCEVLYGAGGTRENPALNVKAGGPSGKRYLNILLGDFTDSSFAYFSNKASNPPEWPPMPKDTYRHCLTMALGDADSAKPVLYDSTTVPSLTNFYYEMSLNKLYFAGDYSGAQIIGVDTIRPSGYTWASANSNDLNYMRACVTSADPYVNFQDPITLGQTVIGIIHPGPCETESGRPGDIWSFSYSGFSIAADGITIRNMFICPQGVMLGVFAHECFHAIGGPDLYDYGYSGTPWGMWSLMDNGSYGGPLFGDQPSFAGGHLQYDLDGDLANGIDGWLDAASYSDSISSAHNGDGQYTVATLDSAGQSREGTETGGIRLWRIRNNAFRDSGQVYFVENRRRIAPYESGLPESGIIITHLDTRMGNQSRFNDGPPCERYYYSWVEQPGNDPNLVYAVGDSNFPRTPDNAAYSANDFSTGGYVENAIDSLTVPNCKTNSGAGNGNGPWIYNISAEGPYMTFCVARTGLAASDPVVGYVSCQVLDPVINGTANNNNGLLDPWETDSIKIKVRNTGSAITAGAACSLYVISGGSYASVTNAGWKQVGSGALAANAEGLSLPFVISIVKDVPRFTDIVFELKFRSTTPGYNSTSNFGLRVSGLQVVQTYDFQDIRVGGADYTYRIQPSDLAILADTLFVGNANLDHSSFYTRVYKVKKNTANNPLIGGSGGDTLGSLNNKGAVQTNTVYTGGMDIDNNKDLWISLADSVYRTPRTNTTSQKFRAPNVDWAGTPMLRIRGIAMGPAVIDTFGPDPWSGDSLWAYWQNFDAYSESLLVLNKPVSGTAVKVSGYSWDETVYGGMYGGQWWNGRALEYDGSSIWTSSVYYNYLIRRNSVNGQLVDIMPGPSSFGSYGTYGMAIEATNSSGIPYAPVGSVAYVPGAAGTRHYLYCASMDEGKIYKVNMTSFLLPTPPDSVVVTDTGNDNQIDWWKSNVDNQKIAQYIIYRQAPGTTTPPTSSDELIRVAHTYGAGSYNTYLDVGAGTKAAYVYTVKSVNYYGEGEWGASVSAPLTGVAGGNIPNKKPLAYVLDMNYPNPLTNGITTIKYQLKHSGQTSLKIYNLLGEEVKTLVNAKQGANSYAVHWDGRDNQGQAVANGVYFYKLNSGDFSASKKLMVLR